jgi:DNA modification methylase
MAARPTAPPPDTLDALTFDPKNARRHSPRNLDAIKASLADTGAARSIVIDEGDRILAGEGTVKAARDLGIKKLQIVDVDGDTLVAVRRRGLSEDAKIRLALADNRTAELAEWDPATLRALAEAQPVGMGGLWTTQELDALMAAGRPPSGAEADALPPAPKKVSVTRGDVYQLGPHRIACADATMDRDVALLADGEDLGAAAMITDPPYCSGGFQEADRIKGSIGTQRKDYTGQRVSIANDVLSTRGYKSLIQAVLSTWTAKVAYVFTDWRMWINLTDVLESQGYGIRSLIVWDKGTPGMGMGWRSQHELIACGTRVTAPFSTTAARGNVVRCDRSGNDLHPTQKPVALLETILDVTQFAKLVVDPFAGAFSTLMACQSRARRCLAMDLSPYFVQVGLDRWEAAGEKVTRIRRGAKSSSVAVHTDGRRRARPAAQ